MKRRVLNPEGGIGQNDNSLWEEIGKKAQIDNLVSDQLKDYDNREIYQRK